VDLLLKGLDILLHLDTYLDIMIQTLGIWSYVIIFLIIFCETGLVVTPVLPGDSLLFAIGTFAALGSFDIVMVLILLTIAAITGDTVNYWIGNYLGPKVFHYEDSRFFKKKHLERTHQFYEKHGGKTIIIARFIPIIRTFAPFVAGIGRMTYSKFLSYNVVGGILWIFSLTLAGYFFGNIPVVRNNFSLVIMAIVVISVIPGFIEYLRQRSKELKSKDEPVLNNIERTS
jgi:membrane-associated protein